MVSTLLGLVALAAFKDLEWKDDDPSITFIYPSIFTESYYYDSKLERCGMMNINVQVDLNMLKVPNGGRGSDGSSVPAKRHAAGDGRVQEGRVGSHMGFVFVSRPLTPRRRPACLLHLYAAV